MKVPEGVYRLCWFALFYLAVALVPHAMAEEVVPAGDQVKAIVKRYREVEEQLPRSIRYAKREETGKDAALVTRAWFNGTGDLLKTTTEQTSPQARELTEFTQTSRQLAYDGLFVLWRKETPASDGGTEVEEARRYYGQATYRDRFGGQTMDNGILIRELRKRAHFAPGEALDTAKTPNTTVEVPKPKESAGTAEEQKAKAMIFEEPFDTARKLRETNVPEFDPFAGVKGDSERFRLIHGSASPDGRYAVAIGFEKPVDWSTYLDTEVEGAGEVFTTENVAELRNYVIELATRRILGATGGSYFGTRQRYNHRESTVTWADDSSVFVQQFDSKWSYESCHAGRIGAGPKLIGTVDLGKAAEKHAQTFLKSKGRRFRGSIALNAEEVKADGTIVLLVIGQEPSAPNKGDIYFQLEETLRLGEKAGKVQLEFVKARLLPNE